MSNLGFAIDRVRDSVDDTRDNLHLSEDLDARRDEKELLAEEDEVEKLLSEPNSRRGTLNPLLGGEPDHDAIARKEDGKRSGRRRPLRIGMVRRRRARDESVDLMHEMEDGANRSSTESDASSNLDREELSKASLSVQSKKWRIRRLAGVHIFILGLFAALVYGAYAASKKKTTTSYRPQDISNGTSTFPPTTLLISLDGFRADFLNRGLTPNLNALIAEGVSPPYMLPSFPSVTFPNHFTLVTGLYPESHSIVGNTFWDPKLQEEFYYTDPKRSLHPRFWLAEPIWTNAQMHDIPAAVHMWPGSEAHIGSREPAYVDNFNAVEPLESKTQRIFQWLDTPGPHDPGASKDKPRPQLIAAYVPNVDAAGHLWGPNSTETRNVISATDKMVGDVVAGLQQRNLTHVINLVVVSDHGMATTSTNRLIQLDKIIDMTQIEHTDGWPLYGLRPKADVNLKALYAVLKKEAASSNGSFEVYLRDEDMPERYHFSRNERIAPLWIIPSPGWAIVTKEDFDVEAAQAEGRVYSPRGLHGYDHEHPLMRAIFIARGPAFPHPKGSRLHPFQNVEVYGLVCDSLGLERKPSNGTLSLPLTVHGVHEGIGQGVEEDDLPADDVPDAARIEYDAEGAINDADDESADRKGWELLQEMPQANGEASNLEEMPTIVSEVGDEVAAGNATSKGGNASQVIGNSTKGWSEDDDEDDDDNGSGRKQSWLEWVKEKAEGLKEWITAPFKSHDDDDKGAVEGEEEDAPYRPVAQTQTVMPDDEAAAPTSVDKGWEQL